MSEGMLKKAQERAARHKVQIELLQMDATNLKFNDSTFNSVVSTFLFCVLPNESQPQALDEIDRVLAPGGKLILMEYVYSKKFWRRLWMKALEPLVHWLYRAGFNRNTHTYLQERKWIMLEDFFVYQDTIRLIIAQKR